MTTKAKPSLEAQKVSEVAWYYEYANRIEVVVEVRGTDGQCVAETQIVRIPWSKLLSSLKRCKP
jgi:hypothetical protein